MLQQIIEEDIRKHLTVFGGVFANVILNMYIE